MASSNSCAGPSRAGSGAGPSRGTNQKAHETAHGRSSSALLVRPEVAGTLTARYIRHVRKEVMRGLVADFVCGPTTGVVLVEFREHLLAPNVVYERIRLLKARPPYRLRILLIVSDGNEGRDTHTLQRLAVLEGYVCFIAIDAREAARYLETLRALDGTNTEEIARLADTNPLNSIRGITKADAEALSFNLGSFQKIARASKDQLRAVPGMGEVKVNRLHNAFHQPFLAQPRQNQSDVIVPEDDHDAMAEDMAR